MISRTASLVTIVALATALLGTGASFAGTSASEEANKRVARLFLENAMTGDFSPIAPHLAPGFKSHDYHIKGGSLEGLKSGVESMAKLAQENELKITGQRLFADGDHVVMHYVVSMKPLSAEAKRKAKSDEAKEFLGVEIFRFADGKIVEHWNADQPVPAQAANANGAF